MMQVVDVTPERGHQVGMRGPDSLNHHIVLRDRRHPAGTAVTARIGTAVIARIGTCRITSTSVWANYATPHAPCNVPCLTK